MVSSIPVDDDIADDFRAAVKQRHGKRWYGNTKREIRVALERHIEFMKENTKLK